MRIVHLYEFEWIDYGKAYPTNILPVKAPDGGAPNGGPLAVKILGKSTQHLSNEKVRRLYQYLRLNGNNPLMTENNGSIRIQYFRWPRGYHYDRVTREFVRDEE